MKNIYQFGLKLSFLIIILSAFDVADHRWGFFGHRRINRLAVFTLNPDMMPLFKSNIEYLTEHAVDPDKRRYAVKDEAIRHYIDLDHWGIDSFDHIPRKYPEVLIQYGDFQVLDRDSSNYLMGQKKIVSIGRSKYILPYKTVGMDTTHAVLYNTYRHFIISNVLPKLRQSDDVIFSGSEINLALQKVLAEPNLNYRWIDTFSIHGILPYYVPEGYKRLVDAFKSKDHDGILRHAADLGHYIGDAHVPLHTTTNYNGQLSNQLGLHAFWESRIPELFADKEYNFFVGKANYIRDVESYIWDVVLSSHSLVDSVLLIEKRLSLNIPPDQQYCFDDRLGVTVKTPCEYYARVYQQSMNGMVERRMREAILGVGSIWYSAWIDAGQPRLSKMANSKSTAQKPKVDDEIEKAYRGNVILGRPEN